MTLTDALLGEHGAFYALFDHLGATAHRAGAAAPIKAAVAVLAALVLGHAKIEEEMLFQALEPHIGEGGPLSVMRAEHEELERLLKCIEDTDDLGQAVGWVEQVLQTARDHFRKEELVLFPLANRILDGETLTRLGRAWAESRHVEIG